MEPDDGDTEQNNTFDDKTSNVISSDDIPVVFCHQVEPDDGDTEQNNSFDDKTSNVISSDDIPAADVKDIGNVTQVSIVDEVSTYYVFF